MRTLLRKPRTGAYYQTLSHWTPNPAQAYDFQALSPAIRFATLAHLPETKVVVGTEGGQLTAIPVASFRSGSRVASLRAWAGGARSASLQLRCAICCLSLPGGGVCSAL